MEQYYTDIYHFDFYMFLKTFILLFGTNYDCIIVIFFGFVNRMNSPSIWRYVLCFGLS